MYSPKSRRYLVFPSLQRMAVVVLIAQAAGSATDPPRLTESDARKIVSSQRRTGQAGKSLDLRLIATDRSFNYKLRALLLTPKVVEAARSLLMLTRGMSQEHAQAAADAIRAEKQYVLVEIDPREGSGVIPRGWTAQLGVKDNPGPRKLGVLVDIGGPVRELLSAFKRDYAYDLFLLEFDLATGPPDSVLELTVRIDDKVGRLNWSPSRPN